MKLQLADYCIRCGICEDLYPDLFRRNYETHSMDILYEEIPQELEERALQAADDCAVAAIKILP
ncbi:MAG: ferredoxin [Lachnospiraceae bacterium]|jgi:ferredoxin|nr:ferredoxin [Lachnospiraceae bacterium]MCI1657697.1 ferredoxin [Lachnospiraceae bacterium]MCI2196113.1 ferredoxin [Lachnospiraceae bacterium]